MHGSYGSGKQSKLKKYHTLPETMDTTLPETDSSHLKMVVSNRNPQTSRGPPFSGAKMLVSGRLYHWKFSRFEKTTTKNANLLDGVFRIALRLFLCCRHRGLDEFQRFFSEKRYEHMMFFWGVVNIHYIYNIIYVSIYILMIYTYRYMDICHIFDE